MSGIELRGWSAVGGKKKKECVSLCVCMCECGCVCARKDNEYEAGRQVETRVCRDRGWSSVFRAVYTA